MKKSVILAVLGLAAGAITSFGQGSIAFDAYFANSSSGATKITFQSGGGLVGAGYTADVLYSLTPITDAAGSGALTPGWLTSGSGAPSVNNVSAPFETGGKAGWFVSPSLFTLTPYTTGTTVYFEVIGYTTGDSYANAPVRGHSASFSDVLATGAIQPAYAQFSSFTLAPVATPEPTTLALAGLGGLASLVALRRKQA